ncbi:MAG: 4Fe-4S binding protein [FCB group bacterium]
MKREIVSIDLEKCDGCGLCIPECKEGALQIIEGKARLVSDLFCDGLGACLGYCPQDAITIEKRESEPYDEIKVMGTIANGSHAILTAHLEHLLEHNETEYLNEALEYLKRNNITNPLEKNNGSHATQSQCGCPGSRIIDMTKEKPKSNENISSTPLQSELRQWPIQLHLINPEAPYFKNAELVIMSTCGPLASAEVHPKYLRGRALVVACPKLDNSEPYIEKLSSIFQIGNTPKAIVVIMEVPCCKGLSNMAVEAAIQSGAEKIIIEEHILCLDGTLKRKSIIYGGVMEYQN